MTNVIAGTASDPPARVGFAKKYRSQVLALLLLGYSLNFTDRMLLAAIGVPIREDMHLTSAQLGLLNGLYFALTYVILGLPVARIADRINRVGVIGFSLCVWSAFTALCGTAASFTTLAVYRFGVGFGEAGFTGPSHSVISDMYEPRKRASALSVFSLGMPFGAIFGTIIGGFISDWFGWRVAFYTVGLPGVLVGVVTWFFVKEPQRGATDAPVAAQGQPSAVKPKFSLAGELKEIGAVSRTLFLTWPMANLVLGMTIVSFSGYGVFDFISQYVYTRFGISLGLTDLLVGLIMGVACGVGTFAGGFIADYMAKRSRVWYVLVPAIGLLVAFPLYALAFTRSSWQAMFLIMGIPSALHYFYTPPSFAVAQNAVPAYRRATMSAFLLFVVNFVALGGGPTFTGALVDYYANIHFVDPTVQSFWPALGSALPYAFHQMFSAYYDFFTFSSHTTFGMTTQAFVAACPGGTAPAQASQAAVHACSTALSWGTQQAILIGLGAYAWGGVHYVLASFGLSKFLKARDTSVDMPLEVQEVG